MLTRNYSIQRPVYLSHHLTNASAKHRRTQKTYFYSNSHYCFPTSFVIIQYSETIVVNCFAWRLVDGPRFLLAEPEAEMEKLLRRNPRARSVVIDRRLRFAGARGNQAFIEARSVQNYVVQLAVAGTRRWDGETRAKPRSGERHCRRFPDNMVAG